MSKPITPASLHLSLEKVYTPLTIRIVEDVDGEGVAQVVSEGLIVGEISLADDTALIISRHDDHYVISEATAINERTFQLDEKEYDDDAE